MRKNATAAILGLMVLLNLILLAYTMALEKNIVNLRTNMSNQFSQLQSDIRSISYNISSAQEEQASIFNSNSWSFGKINPDSLTIPLVVSVVPKEAGVSTTATLTVNDASVLMTRSGMQFSAEIPVELFNLMDAYVTFETEGTQRSQSLCSLMPFEEKLVALYACNNGGYGFEASSGKFEFDGKVDIDLKIPPDNAVSSLKIMTTDNGTPLQEMVLDPTLQYQTVDYKLEILLQAQHTYETVVVATDSYGLTYRAVVDLHAIGADGAMPDFGEMDWWGSMIILDKSGAVLYDSRAAYR